MIIGAQLLDSDNEIVEAINFKTNYSFLKKIVQSQHNFNMNPPGFMSSVPKTPTKLNFVLLKFLMINLPLFKNTDLNNSFVNPIQLKGIYIFKLIIISLFWEYISTKICSEADTSPIKPPFKSLSTQNIHNVDKNHQIEGQYENNLNGIITPPTEQIPKNVYRSPFQSEEKKKRSKLNIVTNQKKNKNKNVKKKNNTNKNK